jgi:hypothetical protein
MKTFWNKIQTKKIPRIYCNILLIIAGMLFGYINAIMVYFLIYDVLFLIKDIMFMLNIGWPLWRIKQGVNEYVSLFGLSDFVEIAIITSLIIIIVYIVEHFGDHDDND